MEHIRSTQQLFREDTEMRLLEDIDGNIKTDIEETGCFNVDWTCLA
jgi:hypothetical protein